MALISASQSQYAGMDDEEARKRQKGDLLGRMKGSIPDASGADAAPPQESRPNADMSESNPPQTPPPQSTVYSGGIAPTPTGDPDWNPRWENEFSNTGGDNTGGDTPLTPPGSKPIDYQPPSPSGPMLDTGTKPIDYEPTPTGDYSPYPQGKQEMPGNLPVNPYAGANEWRQRPQTFEQEWMDPYIFDAMARDYQNLGAETATGRDIDIGQAERARDAQDTGLQSMLDLAAGGESPAMRAQRERGMQQAMAAAASSRGAPAAAVQRAMTQQMAEVDRGVSEAIAGQQTAAAAQVNQMAAQMRDQDMSLEQMQTQFSNQLGLSNAQMQNEMATVEAQVNAQLEAQRDQMITELIGQGVSRNVALMQVDAQMAQLHDELTYKTWAGRLGSQTQMMSSAMAEGGLLTSSPEAVAENAALINMMSGAPAAAGFESPWQRLVTGDEDAVSNQLMSQIVGGQQGGPGGGQWTWNTESGEWELSDRAVESGQAGGMTDALGRQVFPRYWTDEAGRRHLTFDTHSELPGHPDSGGGILTGTGEGGEGGEAAGTYDDYDWWNPGDWFGQHDEDSFWSGIETKQNVQNIGAPSSAMNRPDEYFRLREPQMRMGQPMPLEFNTAPSVTDPLKQGSRTRPVPGAPSNFGRDVVSSYGDISDARAYGSLGRLGTAAMFGNREERGEAVQGIIGTGVNKAIEAGLSKLAEGASAIGATEEELSALTADEIGSHIETAVSESGQKAALTAAESKVLEQGVNEGLSEATKSNPWAAAAAGGLQLARDPSLKGAIDTGATALGSAIGGPIGGAIASAASNVATSAMGMGKPKPPPIDPRSIQPGAMEIQDPGAVYSGLETKQFVEGLDPYSEPISLSKPGLLRSDEMSKSGIGASGDELSEFNRTLNPVKYDYRPEFGGETGQYGIIAQDAQRHPAGQSFVKQAADGTHVIDTGKATMVNMASTANQQRLIDEQALTIKELMDRVLRMEAG
jgi:hypothetical protein